MNRAYSVLEIKSVDDEKRIIEGIASTPATDRMGDVVEPMGAKFTLPLPALLFHDTHNPVAKVTWAKPNKNGIPYRMEFPKSGLLPKVDEAWTMVKEKLIRAVSIGFKEIETARLEKTDGFHFIEWEWLELSLVAIPANAEATITSIKSFDDKFLRAASGENAESKVVRLTSPPGASGKPALIPKGKQMPTIKEHITSLEATRQAKNARMTALMEEAATKGETLGETESQEYDGLSIGIKAVDKDLVRFNELESMNVSKATSIKPEAGTDPAKGTLARSGIISVKQNHLPAGTSFTRYIIALANSKGNRYEAMEFAKARESWRDQTPEVETVLRAAVAAGTTTDTTWAEPLVEYQNMAGEFLEFLRPQTIIGRIPNLRKVPFNIRLASQTAGSTMYWVGEGKPKPVSKLAFGEITLRWAKAAGIVVLTQELIRASSPSAEALVRSDMTAQMAQFLDQQFISPEVGEVANVSPGSITAGVTPTTVSGTDEVAVRTDVKALFQTFITANLDPSQSVWIMTPGTALSLGMMMNTLGQPEFPGINMNGGTFFGLPVIVSNTANVAGSPTVGNMIILVNASEILLADDGQVTIDASREASLQMLDNPTNESGGSTVATTMVSMFQTNSVAILAERWINWKRRRAEAVAWLRNVAYV